MTGNTGLNLIRNYDFFLEIYERKDFSGNVSILNEASRNGYSLVLNWAIKAAINNNSLYFL